MNLTKNYRLVWNDSKEILSIGKYESDSVTGCKNGYEADTKAEIDAKVNELGLKLSEDQKNEWKDVD